ncbi:MAG: hypothetical protein R3E31_06100 [Chloroflexota bacterium]
MITLLIAGHETVASALTWGPGFVVAASTVRTRMEAEVDGGVKRPFHPRRPRPITVHSPNI